jgi:glycerol kinase
MAGDQQAALFGQACTASGLAKNTYGTGCFALINTGHKRIQSQNGMLTTIAWKTPDGETTFAMEGSVFMGGAVVQWLRDGLGIIRKSEEVESLARSVSDNGGVAMVPAFAGLGAPHWNADARGLICGLTRGSTSAHIARAALEGIAFQVNDVLQAMKEDSQMEITELRVDGGGARNGLLIQFQADVSGIPIRRAACLESTALGAALMAGVGAGLFSARDLPQLWKSEKTFLPAISRDEAAGLKLFWNKALARCQ